MPLAFALGGVSPQRERSASQAADQRGINDYTALHYAAARDNAEAVKLLLSRGADPEERTRVDGYAAALEEAERFGHHIRAAALRRAGITT